MQSDTHDNIATMTAEELQQYIKQLEKAHSDRLRTLRALMRARQAEEEAKKV